MFALIRIICMTNDQLTIIVCNKMQIMLQRQKSLASKWFGMCRSLFLILICHYISKSDLYEQSWESTGWLFTVLLRHVSWRAPPCTLISVSLVVRSRELRFIIDLFSLTLIIMMQMSWSVVVDHTCSHYNITIYTYFAGISQTCKYYKLWRHWAILNIFRKWFQTITENLINYIKKNSEKSTGYYYKEGLMLDTLLYLRCWLEQRQTVRPHHHHYLPLHLSSNYCWCIPLDQSHHSPVTPTPLTHCCCSTDSLTVC